VNESIILALANPILQARLRTICHCLKQKGKTKDYITNKDITYLELLMYGISGPTFAQIDRVIN